MWAEPRRGGGAKSAPGLLHPPSWCVERPRSKLQAIRMTSYPIKMLLLEDIPVEGVVVDMIVLFHIDVVRT
uniref:Uncharacterized protein n=1 Tax=Caenorhabditis japonica TaxID=281687 RepID=A0A8R1EEX4_CAEJA